METNQSKSHQIKHGGANDESPVNKCQRLEPSDEKVPEVTKIIHLNDDCLVKIFGRLDLQSLFNVAIANEWLRPAARDVYERKYRARMVQIHGCDDNRPNTRAMARNAIELHTLQEVYDCINISGLKTALQYLRCFGSSIQNLSINYKQSPSNRYGYVHQYINDYCAESLTRISFSEMPNIAIEQFQKTFTNVQNVKISRSDLKKQLTSFDKWFPNLHRLHLYQARMGNFFIGSHFQSLKQLSITDCSTTVLKTKVTDLLSVNRQLEILVIDTINEISPPANDLLDAIRGNASLKALHVFSYHESHSLMKSAQIQRLANEHSTLSELLLHGYQFGADDVMTLTDQLKSLKIFRFWISSSEYSRLVSLLADSAWRIKNFEGMNYWSKCLATVYRLL